MSWIGPQLTHWQAVMNINCYLKKSKSRPVVRSTLGTPAGLALINDANTRIYRGHPWVGRVRLYATLINDANTRIYKGLDPSRQQLVGTPPLGVRDRVEVVFFQDPGTYLVFAMSSTGVERRYASDRGHWQHSV
jgi:hypothetical protein